ncbi:MAG TPA: hypothetical protein PK496_06025 [Bacteroidales bacterium]|nr:hypothetical protein [Bacteroidales bacterium]
MKILLNLLSGLMRSVRIWKWILAVWLATLLLVTLFTFPLKTGINATLGSSMITEKIAAGHFFDVIANDGFNLQTVLAIFFSGLFLVVFAGSILNIFFAGGLFNVLKEDGRRRRATDFFGGAGSNFWSFLVISIISFSVIFLLALIVAGIPAIIAVSSDSDLILSKTMKIASVILMILIPVVVIAADYARAWQVTSNEKNAFRAFGKGIKLMFRSFFVSYISVALILVINLLFSFFAVKGLLYAKASGGGAILLLFLCGQTLAIIKIFIRSWRYGVVTSLYESFH